jgi:anti-sigma regulatory factor (Ser/Thr protein kinase)
MPTTVQLPSRFTRDALYSFTRNVVGQDGQPLDNHFIFDFQRLTFVNGFGLTIFCNTLEWLRALGVFAQFANHAANKRDCMTYLDDCGFFQKYIGKRLNDGCAVRGTTLPFTHVAHADAHGWLEFTFTPWASNALLVPPGALGSVRTCVKELFNNILDHSNRESGYIHVQHYPNMRTVNITVSDFGRGIPATIRNTYGEMTDAAAIRLASERGVTTKGHPNNQGEGLDFLIENVASNDGTVRLYSFSGALICDRRADGTIRRESRGGDGSYPGTLVDICLKTDRFVGDAEEREIVEW